MEARLWTFNDIKDATRRHEEYRYSDNPIRHYFYGVALEMSGQAESADEKYLSFREEAQRRFGDLESAAAYYAEEGEAISRNGDEKSSDHYANMARILRRPEPGGSSKKCVVM